LILFFVAALPLHHNSLLVSFDGDFAAIAPLRELCLQRLNRPV
jgi:hypothetical protein